MAERPTRRAGLIKTRVKDPQLQKYFDAITERLEVLDGVRGDALDKAVTYRDLQASGFTVIPAPGGGSQIINTPGAGDGTDAPGTGPAGPPSNLVATETFLALLLTWDNTAFNIQHIEIFRGTVDNLSLAVKIATTIAPLFVDYVGSNASYYYWVRSVGTDGTFSAYNDTAGTLGTTGIDPSALLVDSDVFVIADPGDPGSTLEPFIVGTIAGITAVGLQGQFIVDGTIRALSIIANSIGADRMNVNQLSALTADMGTLTAGKIVTATEPAFRLEIEDVSGTIYPLWYGSGAKGEAGRFFVRSDGTVVVKGLLEASMIEQSFFTPADANNSFRIATEYPANYSGGVYTGKQAHINIVHIDNFYSTNVYGDVIFDNGAYSPWYSATMQFEGPTESSNSVYSRLGTNSEMLLMEINGSMLQQSTLSSEKFFFLEYQYDAEGWNDAFFIPFRPLVTFMNVTGHRTIFVTRETPSFDTLQFRIRGEAIAGLSAIHLQIGVGSCSVQISTPNFGYADASVTDLTGQTLSVHDLPPHGLWA